MPTPPRPTTRKLSIYLPEMFFNRELSWLDFNWRVLAQAQDQDIPLLERVKFLAISASNLDEFFMKRIGGLHRQVAAGIKKPSRDGLEPREQLKKIRADVSRMVKDQHLTLKQLLGSLAKEQIFVQSYEKLTPKQKKQADHYFENKLLPTLTPFGVGPGHPFPLLSSQSLSIALRVQLEDTTQEHFARVKVPSNHPRFFSLRSGSGTFYIPLESIILAHLDRLFPGARIVESVPFMITRNADIEYNEEEAEDLIELISEELRDRKFAPVVRLVINEGTSKLMRSYLLEELGLFEEDLYAVNGLLRLRDLFELSKHRKSQLHYSPWTPLKHPRLSGSQDHYEPRTLFDCIKEKDLLVHHPYQSFHSSVLRFIEEAADDPKVITIKQTLYRTAEDSPILKALIRAAEKGKQVVVLIEVKARFDEENNLRWVRKLEEAGCHVTYGLVGLKTHAKVAMVVREEQDGVRLYHHIGTGNYHTVTANLYTDLGYFIAHDAYKNDIIQFFNVLTGYSVNPDFKQLLVAPVNMREKFLDLIANEIKAAQAGKPAHIIAKMNQLEDGEIIEALYKASQQGVNIDLIVRGFCCLKPGVKGTSDRIQVRSIVGRFLEHSRIFYFQNGESHQYLIGSADWMRRNLDFRVELAVPVTEQSARNEIQFLLKSCLEDQVDAWQLLPSGKYEHLGKKARTAKFRSQEILMHYYQEQLERSILENSRSHRLRSTRHSTPRLKSRGGTSKRKKK